MKLKILVVIIFVLILSTILNSGCFEEEQKKENENKVKIAFVTQNPEIPIAGEIIIITANVENCSGCGFNYRSFFTSEEGGSRTMREVGPGQYETTIGPFNNKTEIWYMVVAEDNDGSIIISDEYIFQIGEIERSNITTLTISNIYHSPQNPTTKNTHITVSGDLTSNISISYAWLGYMYFYPGGSSSGGGQMNFLNGDTYNNKIYFNNENKDLHLYYKIAVQDESGNTAVSPTFNLTIS